MKSALSIVVITMIALFVMSAYAGDVKYCINLQTQDIITVPANMPCPSNTTEY